MECYLAYNGTRKGVKSIKWIRSINCPDYIELKLIDDHGIIEPKHGSGLHLILVDQDVNDNQNSLRLAGFADDNTAYLDSFPELHKELNIRSDKIEIFQVLKDGDYWTDFLLKGNARKCLIPFGDDADFIKRIPHPTTFIRPAGQSFIEFFNSCVAAIRCYCPDIIGWTFNSKTQKMGYTFSKRTQPIKEGQNGWTLMSYQTLRDYPRYYTYRKDFPLPYQDFVKFLRGQICSLQKEADGVVSLYNNDEAVFRRLTVKFSCDTGECSLILELCTNYSFVANPLPQLVAKGRFQYWREDEDGTLTLWEIKLTDSGIEKDTVVFAYPRLQFPGNRGVYVPPQPEDEVLVTIVHGTFPIADVITKKPDTNDDSATVVIRGAKTTIEKELSVGEKALFESQVNINGKLTVK
ncbi:MAG: hypothetical protein FWE67_15120 [Planctomycetaceae bacterium]|nr:hypothetical protein [Planctomycetaceae bacterium]